MIEANKSSTYEYNGLEKLEQLLSNLTTSLVEQNNCLDRQIATMEKLTQAITQLQSTPTRRLMLESRKPSAELDNLIKMFVEYEINPRYYEEWNRGKAHKRHDSAYVLANQSKPNRPT